jgi:hypothetical protein
MSGCVLCTEVLRTFGFFMGCELECCGSMEPPGELGNTKDSKQMQLSILFFLLSGILQTNPPVIDTRNVATDSG